MENYASGKEKRKQLLLMLCQHEANRLEVWAQPTNSKENAPYRPKISSVKWVEYARTAFSVDPRIALSLVSRFPTAPFLKAEVTQLVQLHILDIRCIPEALAVDDNSHFCNNCRTWLLVQSLRYDDGDKVKEIQRSQEENNFVPVSLDEDPLGQVCKPETRGRVRGEGTVISKKEVEHFASVKSKFEELTTQKSEIQDLKETVALLQGSMNTMTDAIKILVKGNNSNTPCSEAATGFATATPSTTKTPTHRPTSNCGMSQDSLIPLSSPIGYNTPQSIKLEKYHLYGFSHSLPIALGEANPKPTPGTLVHTRPLTEYEQRVNIIKVMDGMENEPLYMQSQAGTTIIGECVGAFVVWPFALMKVAKT